MFQEWVQGLSLMLSYGSIVWMDPPLEEASLEWQTIHGIREQSLGTMLQQQMRPVWLPWELLPLATGMRLTLPLL